MRSYFRRCYGNVYPCIGFFKIQLKLRGAKAPEKGGCTTNCTGSFRRSEMFVAQSENTT